MTDQRDVRREQSISLMADFMRDELYKGQDLSREELLHTAAIYYDLVEQVTLALEKAEKQVMAAVKAGQIDASNPDSVDLLGGPKALDKETSSYFGNKD